MIYALMLVAFVAVFVVDFVVRRRPTAMRVVPDRSTVLDAIDRAERDACSMVVSGARVQTAADRARARYS